MENLSVCRLPGIDLPEDIEFNVSDKRGGKRFKASSGNMKYRARSAPDANFAIAYTDDQGNIKLASTTVLDVTSYPQIEEEFEDHNPETTNWEKKSKLGEAFGTKRTRNAITDANRNKLDVGMLESLEGDILETVKDHTAQLPSQAERTSALEQERPIPPYNLDTKDVKDVYPIDKIVPPRELDTMPIQELLGKSGKKEILAALPYKKSEYFSDALERIVDEGYNVSPRVKLLVYLSLLMAVYDHRRTGNKKSLSEKLNHPPDAAIQGIIERFTINRAGVFGQSRDRSFAFDPAHIDKLLCYALAIILHLEGFNANLSRVSHDFAIKSSKLATLFKSLGCSIKPEGNETFARLTAPVKLPDVVARRFGGGRR